MKISKILVSQPEPSDPKSPYFEIAQSNNIEITFRPFIHVEGVDSKEFRKQKIDILSHTAVVFTSKIAIDHYFRLAEELRLNIPDTMKYFCISEEVAVYLQKYIVYRKRKIFFSNVGKKVQDMIEVMKKHKEETYLLPLSGVHKPEVPDAIEKAKLTYTKAILYNTVSSDLSDVNINDYQVLVFFSPQGIASLKHNFPEFVQGETAIGCLGPTTAQAVKDAGLRLDFNAPSPECPSIPVAIDKFVKKANK
ncbi:MAG: uroporphyrinogen-III synthase [Bacteroidales bacterium]|nr:uroporphyrinogen-III synthase [Bacteroidales bacterium]